MTAPTEPLDITFHDNLAPAVTAGTYTVTVTPKLTGSDSQPIDAEEWLPTETKQFRIEAVQFVLDPSSVHAVFPAPGSSGDYTHVLPHITLNRAILPWERDPAWSRDNARSSWLVLLLFREGELPGDPGALGLADTRTVNELIHPDNGPGNKKILGPALAGLPSETLASSCRSIDIPKALFQKLMPTAEELAYLAHVREVKPATLTRFEGEVLVEGNYAVLTSSRFPRQGGPYTAHLLSLDGHNDPLHNIIPANITDLRLCSLWSWSFTHNDSAHFDPASLLRNLTSDSRTDADALALRLQPPPQTTTTPAPGPDTGPDTTAGEATGEEGYVEGRLKLGYVPVAHRTPSGELGYCWYRGPCTPITAQTVPLPPPNGQTTADHTLIYEAEHGLFDVSYAAAWTLGRTIALSDDSYRTQITAARRELANRAVHLMTPGRYGNDLQPSTAWLQTLARTPLATALAAPPMPPLPPTAPPRTLPPQARTRLATADAATQLSTLATRTLADGPPAWLAPLTQLAGIPYHYLIPDPRMLPPETLRLFAIDENWTQALTDGATSLGLHTTLDHLLHPHLRNALLPPTTTNDPGTPKVGVIIRSELIPAWPEITILARAGTTPLTEIRRDRPAPDTLLILFNQIPTHLTLREPGQGIHFGTDTRPDEKEAIHLRQLKRNASPAQGANIDGAYCPPTGDGIPAYLTTEGVLNLLGTRTNKALIPDLKNCLRNYRPDPNTDLRPAEFAVQLTNSPLNHNLNPQTPPAPLTYGDLVHLQNGADNWHGGYLDTNGNATGTGARYRVSTATTPNRSTTGTGTWEVCDTTGRVPTPQRPVRPGDTITLRNQYGEHTYLDVNNTATTDQQTRGGRFRAVTATGPDRAPGSATWTILTNGTRTEDIHYNDTITLQNRHSGHTTYLATNGTDPANGTAHAVCTNDTRNNTPGDTDWRFLPTTP
ncbi:hypothetical protein ACH4UT_32410 [Streptomyces sp. NPDC020799]|uniref:hypothetical protein n=1 Tax=Streptomyces sp. NPDC020799 TaxID=3365091 RepID=UPI00379D20A9